MNGYSDGFNSGYSDGKHGKSKNYQAHISKAKALVSTHYVDTFIQGYDDGFQKGILDKKRNAS